MPSDLRDPHVALYCQLFYVFYPGGFLGKNIVVVYHCLIPYKQINKCCVSQCVPPVTKHLQKGQAWDDEALAFNQNDPMHKLMH